MENVLDEIDAEYTTKKLDIVDRSEANNSTAMTRINQKKKLSQELSNFIEDMQTNLPTLQTCNSPVRQSRNSPCK